MNRFLIVPLFILAIFSVSADSDDLYSISDSDAADIEIKLDDSLYSYEIGFTKDAEKPKEHVVSNYNLIVSDGKAHDDGNLFIYWEITGKDFLIELNSDSVLKSSSGNLPFYVNWEGKGDDNVITSETGVYSNLEIVPLYLSTDSLTQASIDDYSGKLTLTIRRN